MNKQRHYVKNIDFTQIDHAEKLTKFVAHSPWRCEGNSDRDGKGLDVEIHGFITEDGEFLITNEKFFYGTQQEIQEIIDADNAAANGGDE